MCECVCVPQLRDAYYYLLPPHHVRMQSTYPLSPLTLHPLGPSSTVTSLKCTSPLALAPSHLHPKHPTGLHPIPPAPLPPQGRLLLQRVCPQPPGGPGKPAPGRHQAKAAHHRRRVAGKRCTAGLRNAVEMWKRAAKCQAECQAECRCVEMGRRTDWLRRCGSHTHSLHALNAWATIHRGQVRWCMWCGVQVLLTLSLLSPVSRVQGGQVCVEGRRVMWGPPSRPQATTALHLAPDRSPSSPAPCPQPLLACPLTTAPPHLPPPPPCR